MSSFPRRVSRWCLPFRGTSSPSASTSRRRVRRDRYRTGPDPLTGALIGPTPQPPTPPPAPPPSLTEPPCPCAAAAAPLPPPRARDGGGEQCGLRPPPCARRGPCCRRRGRTGARLHAGNRARGRGGAPAAEDGPRAAARVDLALGEGWGPRGGGKGVHRHRGSFAARSVRENFIDSIRVYACDVNGVLRWVIAAVEVTSSWISCLRRPRPARGTRSSGPRRPCRPCPPCPWAPWTTAQPFP